MSRPSGRQSAGRLLRRLKHLPGSADAVSHPRALSKPQSHWAQRRPLVSLGINRNQRLTLPASESIPISGSIFHHPRLHFACMHSAILHCTLVLYMRLIKVACAGDIERSTRAARQLRPDKSVAARLSHHGMYPNFDSESVRKGASCASLSKFDFPAVCGMRKLPLGNPHFDLLQGL